MAALTTPKAEPGFTAPAFTLPATDGKNYALSDIRGKSGTLVMFICNHCPFVQAIVERIARDAKDLQALGIGVCAVMSNDARQYPEDSFANMKEFAAAHGFTFPYLYDETQEVAKAYGAVCTPDFFGFDGADRLQYRGRLDESRMQPAAGAKRELFEAMKQVAEAGAATQPQFPSMGCSIKWR